MTTRRPTRRARTKMTTDARHRYRTDHHAALRGLLADCPDVREGQMFGYPAFFVGRRMFACVHGAGIGLKVPAPLAVVLLRRTDTVPFQPHGRKPMREWIQINRAVSADYADDQDVLAAARSFVTAECGV